MAKKTQEYRCKINLYDIDKFDVEERKYVRKWMLAIADELLHVNFDSHVKNPSWGIYKPKKLN